MRRTAALLTTVLLAITAACGGGSEGGDGAGDDRLRSSVTEEGVYEVGVDIEAGVYTAPGTDPASSCVSFTATTADYDLEDETADPDAMLAGAEPVRDVQRIEVHDGEFFHNAVCDATWQLEDPSGPTSSDPATLDGACDMLLGDDGLVVTALTFPRRNESAQDEQIRASTQDQLFGIVSSDNEQLADTAGQLVDFLDDPASYIVDGKPDASVLDAVAAINEACEKS